MFITPTPQGARKGDPPIARVTTTSSVRIDGKPDSDETTFEKAALLALAEAMDNGYRAIAFESVHEFITPDNETYRFTNPTGKTLREVRRTLLVYEYVWMFTAHDPVEDQEEREGDA